MLHFILKKTIVCSPWIEETHTYVSLHYSPFILPCLSISKLDVRIATVDFKARNVYIHCSISKQRSVVIASFVIHNFIKINFLLNAMYTPFSPMKMLTTGCYNTQYIANLLSNCKWTSFKSFKFLNVSNYDVGLFFKYLLMLF